MNCFSISQVLQSISAVLACFLAVYIPEKIKWEQRYSQLLSDYRSYDVAAAIQGIIQFFVNDCGCDVGKIKERYENRFYEEIEYKSRKIQINTDNNKILHFQRRLLNSYFFELNECAKRYFLIGNKRVGHDFTENEAKIIKILYFMNLAVEESKVVFKDISVEENIPKARHLKGMNKSIVSVYEILRKSKDYVGV